MDKAIHLPGLNGIRAIAAIAVVISHTTLALGSFGLVATIFGSDGQGGPKGLLMASGGVSMFFALSGFLITYLLSLEKAKNHDINIRNFYLRRIFRIWPLYYLFIASCLLCYVVFNVQYDAGPLPFYIFLLANVPLIIGHTMPFMTHLWSIGVEEQFYLFWPWLARVTTEKLLKLTLVMIAGLYILKLIFYVLFRKFDMEIAYTAINVTRFHIMLIGAAGALLYYKKSSYLKYATNIYTQAACWILMGLLAVNKFNISSLVDNEIIAVVTVAIILAQITRTNMIIDLDRGLMDFLGKISYGIYVIHPLVIFLLAQNLVAFDKSTFANYLFVYAAVMAATIGLSYLSYRFYEKRFILMKSRFSSIKSEA